MARLSRIPKTPQDQVIVSDEEEEEEDVNAGAMEPSSDAIIGPSHDEVHFNFDELPNTPHYPTSSPPQTRSATKMGNEQSREATNAALHKTTDTLLKDSTTRKKSNGKLPKVPRTASTNANPPYQNPVAKQRRLPEQSAPRGDIYEHPDDETERPVTRKRAAEGQPQISPRKHASKKTKTTHKESDAHPPPEAQPQSPDRRRSERQRQQLEEVKDSLMNSSIRKGPFTAEEQKDKLASEQQKAPFTSWNRGRGAVQNEDAGAGAEDDEDEDEGDTIDVASAAAATTSTQKAPKVDAKGKQPQKAGVSKKSAKDRPRKLKGPRGRPSKGRPQSAVESVDDEEQEGRNASDGLFVPDEEGNDDDDNENQRTLHVDKARKSEMFPNNSAGDDADNSEGEAEQEPFTMKPKKPSKDSKNSIQANTSKKRRPETDQSVDPNAPTLNAEGQDTRPWLHGQYNLLRRVLKNVEYVGCNVEDGVVQRRNKIKSRDEQVKGTVLLCDKAIKRLKRLSKRSGQLDAQSDPAGVLTEISQRVDGLRGLSDEFEVDFDSSVTCTEIYAHLIPRLVELLWDATQCYLIMDKNEAAEGQIKIGHLQIALQITKMILDMEKAAETKYTKHARPHSELAVVRPVHNGIAVPLRDLYKAFNRTVQTHYVAIREDERRQYEATYDADRLEREARAKRQEAKLREVQKKWENLHLERQSAEGGLVRTEKQMHLEMPSHNIIEFDENGEAFTRAEGFLPRVGPNPSMIAEASAQLWSTEQLEALMDGLKTYTGPRVFENTFRRYCGRGKPLNRFNVTEIVTTAAKFRELETASQMEENGVVDEWVTAIPVWTKGQAGVPGQENEDSVVEVSAEP